MLHSFSASQPEGAWQTVFGKWHEICSTQSFTTWISRQTTREARQRARKLVLARNKEKLFDRWHRTAKETKPTLKVGWPVFFLFQYLATLSLLEWQNIGNWIAFCNCVLSCLIFLVMLFWDVSDGKICDSWRWRRLELKMIHEILYIWRCLNPLGLVYCN